MHACCENPKGCLLAMFCPPCFAYHLRTKALNGDMSKYRSVHRDARGRGCKAA